MKKMKEIDEKELKTRELNILKEFNSFCKANNLRYSIAYGTMIGAIRHKGFIPWDDDIDVIMPREDYDKLIGLQYEDNNYKILNYSYSKGYYYLHSKMIDKNTILIEPKRRDKKMGVYIDIFPMDRVDGKYEEKIIKEMQKNRKIYLFLGNKPSKSKGILFYYFKYIIKIVLTPFIKKILFHIEQKAKKTNGNDYIQLVHNLVGKKDKITTDEWLKLIDVDFENLKVSCISNYDSYLKNVYGNYMELPPKEERITHHSFKAYTKE